jgi:hypothetical protein
MNAAIRRGDVVLIDDLGQGWISASIALGELLRRPRSPYAMWTHIAIVYDVPYQDPYTIKIVEATASAGVRKAFLSKYQSRYAIGHTEVGYDDWLEVKEFLECVLRAREKYDFVAYAGLTLYALTGTHVCIQRAGTATCAGLVADALTRRGFVWSRPPYAMTPAMIAADLVRSGCTISSNVASGAGTSLLQKLFGSPQ